MVEINLARFDGSASVIVHGYHKTKTIVCRVLVFLVFVYAVCSVSHFCSHTDSKMSRRRLVNLRDTICATVDALLEEDTLDLANDLATSFNRSRTTEPPSGRPTRRRRPNLPMGYLNVKVTCLGSPETETTSTKELIDLGAIGLGNGPEGHMKSKLYLDWTCEDMRDFLETKFPKLKGEEYEFLKAGSDRKLVALPSHVKCPKDIKVWGCLNRSALYVRPKRNIKSQCDEPSHTDDEEPEIWSSPQSCAEPVSTLPARKKICTVCSRSMDDYDCYFCIKQNDCVISARIDLEKANERALKAAREAELYELRQQRYLNVAEEPDDGFGLRVMLPNGTSCVRRFLGHQPFKDLVNFVGSKDDATRHFKFVLPNRRSVSSSMPGTLRLSSVGIAASMVINVDWDDDETLDVENCNAVLVSYDCIIPEDEVPIESAAGENSGSIPILNCTAAVPSCDRDPDIMQSDVPIEFPDGNVDLVPRKIHLSKRNIMQDLLTAFEDDSIINETLHFTLQGESGQDNGGVAREALTRFWCELHNRFGQGMHVKVLCVSVQMSETKWQIVGKILGKGFNDYGMLPLQMNESFLVACMCGYHSVDESQLMAAIVSNMSRYENELCQKADDDALDSEEEEHFVELMESYECGFIPKKGQVKRTLLDIAHTRFLQSTKCIIDNIHEGYKCAAGEKLPSVQILQATLRKHVPTTKLVLKLFKSVMPMSEAQGRSLRHLKEFIRSLDPSNLKCFVRLLTGSLTVTVEEIFVNFISADQPLFFRTCGPALDLPMYRSSEQLAYAFRTIMDAESWEFNRL